MLIEKQAQPDRRNCTGSAPASNFPAMEPLIEYVTSINQTRLQDSWPYFEMGKFSRIQGINPILINIKHRLPNLK
ncbi:hypothetical protein HanXRQr2_Chr08g0350101 [Helianthus annuus]|uniref:Uncharacterized protein n=1 Tax=Helianthus annuus TaxID=4232 RepID=A0A9K3IGI6_HELAN|nr:hypothetical protein HanXRQr2_Chr08g0350101 [Helianthus annuus]